MKNKIGFSGRMMIFQNYFVCINTTLESVFRVYQNKNTIIEDA